MPRQVQLNQQDKKKQKEELLLRIEVKPKVTHQELAHAVTRGNPKKVLPLLRELEKEGKIRLYKELYSSKYAPWICVPADWVEPEKPKRSCKRPAWMECKAVTVPQDQLHLYMGKNARPLPTENVRIVPTVF